MTTPPPTAALVAVKRSIVASDGWGFVTIAAPDAEALLAAVESLTQELAHERQVSTDAELRASLAVAEQARLQAALADATRDRERGECECGHDFLDHCDRALAPECLPIHESCTCKEYAARSAPPQGTET